MPQRRLLRATPVPACAIAGAFLCSRFAEGRYPERALVADATPTLAWILGVTPIERLDGRVLERALSGSTSH